MSLLRASLARLAPPAQGFRALSTSAILRDASTPVKVDPSQTRDIVKEQHERQSDAVVADVINDAPRAYRGACAPERLAANTDILLPVLCYQRSCASDRCASSSRPRQPTRQDGQEQASGESTLTFFKAALGGRTR